MKGLFLTYQQTLPAKLLWGIENIAVSILAKLKSYSRPLWELTRTHMTCHLVLFDRYLVFFLEVIHHTIFNQGRRGLLYLFLSTLVECTYSSSGLAKQSSRNIFRIYMEIIVFFSTGGRGKGEKCFRSLIVFTILTHFIFV